MTEYDQGYKLLFSHPQMVQDLLTGFVREDWVKELDFKSLERISASYVSDDLRERHDDVVWRVRFSDQWLYVYLILEFQSSVDMFMAVRMMTYVGLLYQDLVRTKQHTNQGKLPPVLPMVLYNGEPRWHEATDIFTLIENIPGSLAKFSPRLQYLLIDEGAYEQTELHSLKNLVSVLFQLEKTPVKELSTKLLNRLIEWVSDNKELQRAFLVFLKRVYFKGRVDVDTLYLEASSADEVKDMLSKNVERWIEEWKAEGEARGEHRERKRLAQRLLSMGMSISQIVDLTSLSEEEVKDLRNSLCH